MLDHMSGGRVECAVGRGIYGREALQLNKAADTRNPAQNFRIFNESLELIRRAWANEFFEYDGEFFRFPDPKFVWDHAMSDKDAEYQDMDTLELKKLALVPRRCSSHRRRCTRWSMAICQSSMRRKTISMR